MHYRDFILFCGMWKLSLGRSSSIDGDWVALTKCRSQFEDSSLVASSVVFNSPLHHSIFPGLVHGRQYDTSTSKPGPGTLWPRYPCGCFCNESCCVTQLFWRCHFATGLAFQSPGWCSRQWRGARGASPAIQWLFLPL